MTTHHVCVHPGFHTLRIGSVVVLWSLLTLTLVPRVLLAHAPNPAWWLLLLTIVPGISLVKTLMQWRCQPLPGERTRGRDWFLLAALLAGRH